MGFGSGRWIRDVSREMQTAHRRRDDLDAQTWLRAPMCSGRAVRLRADLTAFK